VPVLAFPHSATFDRSIDYVSGGIKLSDCVPGGNPHVDNLLDVDTSDFPPLRSVIAKLLGDEPDLVSISSRSSPDRMDKSLQMGN
jgi:hypothetical protein